MGVPNRNWKVDDGNSNFDMCDTYPPLIYVPTMTNKAILLGSSKFRSRGRLPVLTYLHPNGVRDDKRENHRKSTRIFFLVFFFSRFQLLDVHNRCRVSVLDVKKMNNFLNLF